MNAGIRKFLGLSLLALLQLSVLWLSACGNNPLTFAPDKLPQATSGQPFQTTITVSGNKTPVGYIGVSSGALPTGLTINYEKGNNTALISGTPMQKGTFIFTIDTWCMGTNKTGQSGHQDYELVVT